MLETSVSLKSRQCGPSVQRVGQRHPGGRQRPKGDGQGLSMLGGASLPFHRNSAGSSLEEEGCGGRLGALLI